MPIRRILAPNHMKQARFGLGAYKVSAAFGRPSVRMLQGAQAGKLVHNIGPTNRLSQGGVARIEQIINVVIIHTNSIRVAGKGGVCGAHQGVAIPG